MGRVAAELGHILSIKNLVQNGSDINIKDNNKQTALQLTVTQRDERDVIVSYLMEKGAKAFVRDSTRKTPLHNPLKINIS
jgi:ankyrin repeat protein